MDFKTEILTGIPDKLPKRKEYDITVNHAPIRENILSTEERKLALKKSCLKFPIIL